MTTPRADQLKEVMVDQHRITPRVIRPRPLCLECAGRASRVFTDVGRVLAHSCERHHDIVNKIVEKKLQYENRVGGLK